MANKPIFNLSGGMNTKASPLIIKDTESELIINYNLDTTGALVKRNGYDVFASQPVASRRVHGLYQFTHTTTTAETTQVMVVNNAGSTQGVIYYNNAGTWTSSLATDTVVSTFTNFNRTRFATFLDYIFRVNGLQVVATSTDVNGGTWGTTNAPGTIIPAFVAVFQDRVYMVNDRRASPNTHGSRAYFSSLPSTAATPVITWDVTNNYFDVNPDDGDEITAVENNGNRLLFFKRRSMYRWNFGQTEPDRLIGVGTHSHECVKTNLDLGITFFANEYGTYAYTTGRPKLISRKIQKWFDAIPAADLDDMCAETDSDHYYLYLSDSMSVDSVTYTNIMAVYTISLDAWVIYSFHTPVRVMSKLILSGSEDIYFGSSNGRTYQLNIGTADDSAGANGDTAIDINTQILSKEFLLTFPEKTTAEYVDFVGRSCMLTQSEYQLNRGGDFKPLKGSMIDRFNAFRIGEEARTIRLRIAESSQIASIIEGFNIQHTPKAERKP